MYRYLFSKSIWVSYLYYRRMKKKFPFKVGDKVITKDGTIGIIDRFKPEDAYPYCIEIDGGYCYWCSVSILKSYKEMERNVTLTLEKAKEWYNKGGELKEIALQAYSEEELSPLPRSWEEFCKNGNPIGAWRYTIPQKYEAFYKLEQLRNCWRNGWKPEWDISCKYCIKLSQGELFVGICVYDSRFLVFPTREMAEEFLKCFRDLIEQARDLI